MIVSPLLRIPSASDGTVSKYICRRESWKEEILGDDPGRVVV